MNKEKLNKPFLIKAVRSNSTFQLPLSELGENSHITFIQYDTRDFVIDLNNLSDRKFDEKNYKNRLLSAWEKAKENKVFNYDLQVMYKLLDGLYNLSIQFNAERGLLRRRPMHFHHIKEPFNHLRWNFTKLKPNEILFYLKCVNKPYTNDPVDTHIIAINSSPLEHGHILIVPSISKCLPQILTDVSLRISIDLMLLVEDENFHICFNSLLGYASINHLHLHGLFWPYDSDLINKQFECLYDQVFVIRRPDWFIDTLVFQLEDIDKIDIFTKNLLNCANFLTNLNIAHNLFFSRAPPIFTSHDAQDKKTSLFVTAYLIPRRSITGAKPPTNFCPAALELVGLMTSYTLHFFESATENSIVRIIEKDAVLDVEIVNNILNEISLRLKEKKSWQDFASNINCYTNDIPSSHELTTHELEELEDNF